jgi:hypothetical protein
MRRYKRDLFFKKLPLPAPDSYHPQQQQLEPQFVAMELEESSECSEQLIVPDLSPCSEERKIDFSQY